MVLFHKKFLLLIFFIAFQHPLFGQWSGVGLSIDQKRVELFNRIQAAHALGIYIDGSFESWVGAVPDGDQDALDTLEKHLALQEDAYHQAAWADYGRAAYHDLQDRKSVAQQELGMVDICKKKLRGAVFCLLAAGLPIWFVMSYFAMSMGMRAAENVQELAGADLLDICLNACRLVDGTAKGINAGDNYSTCKEMPLPHRMHVCGKWAGSSLPRLAVLGGVAYVGYKLLYKMCCGGRRR